MELVACPTCGSTKRIKEICMCGKCPECDPAHFNAPSQIQVPDDNILDEVLKNF